MLREGILPGKERRFNLLFCQRGRVVRPDGEVGTHQRLVRREVIVSTIAGNSHETPRIPALVNTFGVLIGACAHAVARQDEVQIVAIGVDHVIAGIEDLACVWF